MSEFDCPKCGSKLCVSPTDSAVTVNVTVEYVQNLFPTDLEEMLTFNTEGEYIVVKPRQFLGSENFAKIASVIREAGGEYISAGKGSHFRVKKNG